MTTTLTACVLTAVLSQPLGEISTRKPDVVYGRKHGMALTMDVLTPKENANGVGIIYVAAGGWFSAHSMVEGEGPPIGTLVRRGYTVFGVVMGSQPRFTIPELVEDLNRAARFIRANSKQYGIDPERLGVCGGSAGGHLSLMLATAGKQGDPNAKDPIDRESSRVKAAAVFFPPTDFLNYGKEGENAVGRGTLKGYRAPFDFNRVTKPADPNVGSPLFERITDENEILAIAKDISPVNHVSADDPPTLIIHGDADLLVPIQQAEIFKKKMDEVGAKAEISVRPGKAHGWGNIGEDWAVIADWFDQQLLGKTSAK